MSTILNVFVELFYTLCYYSVMGGDLVLELYENIKSRRLALNMTQSELAEIMGYADKSMIAKIEKGIVDLPQSKIIAFANALKVKPGDLMGFDGVKPLKEKGVTIKVLGRVVMVFRSKL